MMSAYPLPSGNPQAHGVSAAGIAAIDAFFQREIAAHRLPGAVLAIAREGKLVHHQAYGQRDPMAGAPMTLDTVFPLASMTKIMVSVAALKLMQVGRLPLRSRLDAWFAAFADMQVGLDDGQGGLTLQPQQRPILIHDLLRHTSGITYGGRGLGPAAALWPSASEVMFADDAASFIDRITRLPLTHQPGTAFEYGFSTDVLGLVIEKVTGERLGEHLLREVWQPLGMNDTGFELTQDRRARGARPLPFNPLDGSPQAVSVMERQTTLDWGGAAAMGTVSDYLRFGQMLHDGGVLDGERILSPQTVALMTANHLGEGVINTVHHTEPHREGYGFGLGVAVRTQAGLASVPGRVGEFTWNGAYGTIFFADPAERLVVVAGTVAPGEIRKHYREQLQVLVYGALTR
jgi:CubicO group peptidase (beta-lactamase class C family)